MSDSMLDVCAARARELAPYQGRPHPEARPVGDPAAGSGAPVASDPDRARTEEVAHAYRQVGASSIAAPELATSDVAREDLVDPATGALAESIPSAGGVLVPSRYAIPTRRRG